MTALMDSGVSTPDTDPVPGPRTPASALAIPTVLAALEGAATEETRVLSAYLDTSSGGNGRGHVVDYRDRCRELRRKLAAQDRLSGTAEEVRFAAAADRVEHHVVQAAAEGRPGVAVFASGSGDWLYTAPLPASPRASVAWGSTPVLEPLHDVLDELERVALVLFDTERARLFTIYLGSIEERRELADEVPGRQKTGGWFALAQTRYARHQEDRELRHAKHTVREIMALARLAPFDRLFLGGPEDAVAFLRRHLPRRLRARLSGVIPIDFDAGDGRILMAVRQAAEAAERRAELEELDELFDAATARRAALGIDETLAALAEGRVHVLYAAETFDASGQECPRCARIFAVSTEPTPSDTPAVPASCPVCGAVMRSVSSVRGAAAARARVTGARVETVGGEAAERLLARGGLAAWLRYG